MAKYYVRSGQLEKIVITDTPNDAAYQAVNKAEGEEIDVLFCIDERGFRGPTPLEPSFNSSFLPEYVFNTNELLEAWEY